MTIIKHIKKSAISLKCLQQRGRWHQIQHRRVPITGSTKTDLVDESTPNLNKPIRRIQMMIIYWLSSERFPQTMFCKNICENHSKGDVRFYNVFILRWKKQEKKYSFSSLTELKISHIKSSERNVHFQL